MPDVFTCPGCRQRFVVSSSSGDELREVCPIEECHRTIWMRGKPNGGFVLETDEPPDARDGRFWVDRFRLLDDGDVVLSGPADRLRMLADMLNRQPPEELELPDRVLSFMQAFGRGCTFMPGHRLIELGYARRLELERKTHARL